MKCTWKQGMKTVGFLLGLTAILFGLSLVFAPKNNQKEFGIEDVTANGILGEKEKTIDVIVLGNSEAYTAISPMQIWSQHGFTSYVCATPSQRLYLTKTFLEKAFEKQAPKIVLLETNAVFRPIDRGQEFMAAVESMFPVVKYHDRWKNLNPSDFGTKTEFTWSDDNKGFHYNSKVLPSTKINYMHPTDAVQEVPATNQQYVLDMKAYAEARGAKFILLSTPSSKNWSMQRHNGMAKFAKENGIEFHDLNRKENKVVIDWNTDTMDRGDHLNYQGTLKVTNWVGDFLAKQGLLTDHRNDAVFAAWNDNLNRYWFAVGEQNNRSGSDRLNHESN